MSNILKELENILKARYGKDVRQSIHDAIKKVDEVADTAQNSASNSAKSALASETSAKASMESALASAESAKESAEKAFAGTPEGYQALVEQVGRIDIAKSTGNTLYNTKHGGLRLTKMVGNTVQNGTPTPSAKQPMYHTSDVVEMIQGYYNTSTGVYATSTSGVCSKNPIPCKSGDSIKVCNDNASYIYILFYNESGFIGEVHGAGAEFETSANASATSFKINIVNSNGLTLDTVGKITLTINGKYVGCVKGHGKNFLDCRSLSASTVNGITFTPTYNSKGELEYILVNGTASAITYIALSTFEFNDDFIVSGCPSGGSYGTYFMNISSHSNDYGNGTLVTNDGTSHTIQIGIANGYTANNLKFYPMIRKADITDDTYEPYQETLAYFLTEKPMMADSVLFNENGLFKVEHTKAEIVFDGSSDEAWEYETNTDVSTMFIKFSIVAKPDNNYDTSKMLCDRFMQARGDAVVNERVNKFILFTNKAFQIYLPSGTFTDLASGKEWLANNSITVQYTLAEPTIEVLDTESQLALHGLKTFDNVTYLEVDSRIPPTEIEVEHGTSQVGAYTLQALNENDIDKVERAEMKAKTETLRNMILSLGGNA